MEQNMIKKILNEILFIECEGYKADYSPRLKAGGSYLRESH